MTLNAEFFHRSFQRRWNLSIVLRKCGPGARFRKQHIMDRVVAGNHLLPSVSGMA
jgi:hypothetical protein